MGFGVGVERGGRAAVSDVVGVYAAKSIEVIEEWKDEFQAVSSRGGDGVVQTANAGVGVHVEVLPAGIEDLVVDIRLGGGIIGGAEAPDAGDFEAGLGDVRMGYGYGSGLGDLHQRSRTWLG